MPHTRTHRGLSSHRDEEPVSFKKKNCSSTFPSLLALKLWLVATTPAATTPAAVHAANTDRPQTRWPESPRVCCQSGDHNSPMAGPDGGGPRECEPKHMSHPFPPPFLNQSLVRPQGKAGFLCSKAPPFFALLRCLCSARLLRNTGLLAPEYCPSLPIPTAFSSHSHWHCPA